jgi:hypothetical protein
MYLTLLSQHIRELILHLVTENAAPNWMCIEVRHQNPKVFTQYTDSLNSTAQTSNTSSSSSSQAFNHPTSSSPTHTSHHHHTSPSPPNPRETPQPPHPSPSSNVSSPPSVRREHRETHGDSTASSKRSSTPRYPRVKKPEGNAQRRN